MATKKVDWSALAESKNPANLAVMLGALEDTSVPKLEARFLTLTTWPKQRAIADAAASWFQHFPIRFREQLGTGCAALGALVLHGAPPSFAESLKKVNAPNDLVPKWRALVATGAARLLGPRKPFGKGASGAALPAGPRAALQTAFLERAEARREGDLPDLLNRLGEGPATDIAERLVLLTSLPRTAAIADAAAMLIARPPVRYDPASSIFPLLALLLIAHGDASHRKAAQQLGSEITSLAWVELGLSTEKRSAAPKTKSSGPKSEGDFLKWLAEAPTDLSRRHAFADSLQEQGNPRGEFMALQLSSTLEPKAQKRMAALQKKHERDWLRAFWKIKRNGTIRFQGGVLTGIDVVHWGPAGDVPTPGEPQLATLERLWIDGGNSEALRALVASPMLGAVRDFAVPARLLDAVPKKLGAQLTTLGVHVSWHDDETGVGAASRHIDSMTLPKLPTVHLAGQVRSEAAPIIAKAKWPKRIERLIVESIQPEAFWAIFPKLGPKVLEVRPELGDSKQYCWVFEKDSLDISGPGSDPEGHLLEGLDALGPAIRKRAAFTATTPLDPALAKQLAAFGVSDKRPSLPARRPSSPTT
ncbi:MAG: TIGR02996 domain-containing protein [Myxococcaceae bacterium]